MKLASIDDMGDVLDVGVRVSQPGSFDVVPQGTWHTANPHAPTTMLFVTAGEDTENREQPG